MALHTYPPVERRIFQYDGEDLNGNNFSDCTDAAEYLKVVLSQRFVDFVIPNACLFFPTELGGLGLKSASIALHLIRDLASESSFSLLGDFQYTERREHRLLERQTSGSLRGAPASGFNEYMNWREELHYGYDDELANFYYQLLEPPPMESSLYDTTGLDALLSEPHGCDTLRDIASGKFPGIGSYWRRVILLYGHEAMERFGSLRLVDLELLRMGNLNLRKE